MDVKLECEKKIIMDDLLEICGLIGVIIIILILFVLIPMGVTIVLGIYIANVLHLTGIVWWSFLILFYLIISGILSFLSKG